MSAPRKLRVLVLMLDELVPPDIAVADPASLPAAPWKTEYDVVHTLRALGHDVHVLGVGDSLGPIRNALFDFKPHVAFNLLEAFANVVTWDQNVVAYLELLRTPYTGCNPRGLMLGRDKALSKKLLSWHRVPIADFAVFPRGRAVRAPKRLEYPLIVKSLTLDASIGIAQASVVADEARLRERIAFVHEKVGTDALVERYVEGRELYVGIIGNVQLQVLPIWELRFGTLPADNHPIATGRMKWNVAYQQKHGIDSGPAEGLAPAVEERIRDVCRRTYRSLMLSGYARIDLRLTPEGEPYVIEANPNPQISRDEDFAHAARAAGLDYGPLLQRVVNLGLRWDAARAG